MDTLKTPVVEGCDMQVLNPITTKHFITATTEVHVKRMKQAVIWSIFMQLLFLFLFIMLIKVNIFYPLAWLADFINELMSVNLWLKMLVLGVTICIEGEVCKRDYVTGPLYHATRLKKMKHVFSLRNVVLLLLHQIIGITVVWIYSSLVFQHSFTKQCTSSHKSSEFCLVEKKLFFLLGGSWIGLYYFISDYMFGSRNLRFPFIQQYKIYRMKAALKENLTVSMRESIVPTITYFVLYLFYGSVFRGRFIKVLSCSLETELIDSFQGIMDLKLFLSSWIFSCIFFVTLRVMEILFNVYLTEHCVFPVTTEMLPPGHYLTLTDSLKVSNPPIIHHLGYLDLFTLSTNFPERRQEVFTLSRPGGHPHSWNKIYQECTNLIKCFTSDLSLTLQENVTCTTNVVNENLSVKLEPARYCLQAHNVVRRLAPPQPTREGTIATEYQSAIEVALNTVQMWFQEKQAEIYKKPYIAFFLAESPNSRINYLLCQCRPVIWAVQSLAHLSAASLCEDQYGIVQRDLPDIIISIVSLKQVLDKLFKQNLIVKKSFATDPLEVQMKYLLRSSVKRSLYKLAVSFGPYIQKLRLPCEVDVQMNCIIEFKEVL